MRKKFMAGMLAATLALGMNTAVFADSEKSSEISPSLEKTFTLTNEGTTSPKVTFSFSDPVCVSVTDSAITSPMEAPKVTVGSITYNEGEAPNSEKSVSLKIPGYESVGVYKYEFEEVASNILGIECFKGKIYLTVTVTYDENKNLVANAEVYTDIEGKGTADAKKVDNLVNTYSAGSLSVKKEVTGNMGDKKKDFMVHVTFKNSTDKKIDSTISYETADGKKEKITPEMLNDGTYTADIELSDQDTVTFTNIPYGVTYSVTEEDYTGDKGGYAAAVVTAEDEGGETGVIDSANEKVVVTNNKEKDIDTGINLDSMPYLMMMGVACAGMFTFFTKKRMARED